MEKCPPLSYQDFLLECGDEERDFVKELNYQQKRLKEDISTFNTLIHRGFGLFVRTDRGFTKNQMGAMAAYFERTAKRLERLHGALERWNRELEEELAERERARNRE